MPELGFRQPKWWKGSPTSRLELPQTRFCRCPFEWAPFLHRARPFSLISTRRHPCLVRIGRNCSLTRSQGALTELEAIQLGPFLPPRRSALATGPCENKTGTRNRADATMLLVRWIWHRTQDVRRHAANCERRFTPQNYRA